MTKNITTHPTLKDLIASRNFDYVNPEIEKADWPKPKEIGTDFKLYNFDRYISSKDAIKEMEKDDYRPANIYELLSWTGWNDKDWVVALGSVTKVYGNRSVPCLGRRGSERDLYLPWWGSDWDSFCRFLAVATGSHLPGGSASGPSDTFTLDSAIKLVKDNGYKVIKEM